MAAAVIKDEQGRVLGDSEAVNASWRALFKKEFRDVGLELPCDDEFFLDEPVPLAGAGEPLTLEQWSLAIGNVAAAIRAGRAPGPDLVPPELIKYSGPGCWRLLAAIAVEVCRCGLPNCWRGGIMVPVPKRPKLPLSTANAWANISSP